MKKIIILTALFTLSLASFAQKKPEAPKPKTDSIDIAKIVVLSPTDIAEFDQQVLSEIPSKYVDVIRGWFQQRISDKLKRLYPQQK